MVMSRIQLRGRTPARIAAAVGRRLLPSHPKFGYAWFKFQDGTVSFREVGFVAASSPVELLARHNHETATIRRLLGDGPVTQSLEVGCGYGRLTPTFSSNSAKHVAVDVNETALEQARMVYPALDFRRASATGLPFADEMFERVTTWTVLQHIPPANIQDACKELVRVLSTGGHLLICEETRYAAAPVSKHSHTWHRTVDTYRSMLSPLNLVESAEIDEINRIPGMRSPGCVMLWEKT